MKVLFLPNWRVTQLDSDTREIQAPNKQVRGASYWFFRHFPTHCAVDIIDIAAPRLFTWIEKRLNFYIWQGLRAFLTAHRYDVVISHGAQSGLTYSLLRTLTFRKRPPHIIFDIGGMNGGRIRGFENLLIGFALRSNPYIICHSRVIIANYQQTYKSLLTRTWFIPFGADIDDFSPDGNSGAEPYVLSFGDAFNRDYSTLLEAWQRLGTDVRLRIVGCRGEATHGNIEFIERVSIAELRRLIANARFVVIPLPVFNYSYGQMSFLQSMSVGKAVVVTETPSSVDYIEHGNGAFLVRPYDIESMHDALAKLLGDDELLARSSARARPYVAENFSEQKMAKGVFDVIQTILATTSHPVRKRCVASTK